MRTVILVHGFWHGTWCWSPVTARLAALGVPSVAVDLEGHGLRAKRAGNPVDTLIEDIRLIGGGEPCVVVAHSMAGAVATIAAEREPALFEHLMFVAAFAPVTGPVIDYFMSPENAGEMVNRLLSGDPAETGVMRVAADPEQIRETFYHDVDPDISDAAMGLLTADAPAAITVADPAVTRYRFGRVPHSYVVCAKDNTVPAALQRRFVRDLDEVSAAPTTVVELDSAHSPFLSHPDELAAAIAGVSSLDGRRSSPRW